MTRAIEFRSVTKAYGRTPVLSGFSLTIEEDETTALVGESGSGKSTLLMMCNGLLAADAGSVHVLGEPVESTDLVALRRRIGYAVQGAGLFPHLWIVPQTSAWSPACRTGHRRRSTIVFRCCSISSDWTAPTRIDIPMN